jgi:hypothetical protein
LQRSEKAKREGKGRGKGERERNKIELTKNMSLDEGSSKKQWRDGIRNLSDDAKGSFVTSQQA